jgi:hypothetical protein
MTARIVEDRSSSDPSTRRPRPGVGTAAGGTVVRPRGNAFAAGPRFAGRSMTRATLDGIVAVLGRLRGAAGRRYGAAHGPGSGAVVEER